MADIVQFKPKGPPPAAVWSCDCGCVTFYLFDSGAVQCAQCKSFQWHDAGGWNPDGERLLQSAERM